jgi:hypothetical protein
LRGEVKVIGRTVRGRDGGGLEQAQEQEVNHDEPRWARPGVTR